MDRGKSNTRPRQSIPDLLGSSKPLTDNNTNADQLIKDQARSGTHTIDERHIAVHDTQVVSDSGGDKLPIGTATAGHHLLASSTSENISPLETDVTHDKAKARHSTSGGGQDTTGDSNKSGPQQPRAKGSAVVPPAQRAEASHSDSAGAKSTEVGHIISRASNTGPTHALRIDTAVATDISSRATVLGAVALEDDPEDGDSDTDDDLDRPAKSRAKANSRVRPSDPSQGLRTGDKFGLDRHEAGVSEGGMSSDRGGPQGHENESAPDEATQGTQQPQPSSTKAPRIWKPTSTSETHSDVSTSLDSDSRRKASAFTGIPPAAVVGAESVPKLSKTTSSFTIGPAPSPSLLTPKTPRKYPSLEEVPMGPPNLRKRHITPPTSDVERRVKSMFNRPFNWKTSHQGRLLALGEGLDALNRRVQAIYHARYKDSYRKLKPPGLKADLNEHFDFWDGAVAELVLLLQRLDRRNKLQWSFTFRPLPDAATALERLQNLENASNEINAQVAKVEAME